MKKVSIIGSILLILSACTTKFNPHTYLSNLHGDLLMQGNSVAYADGYIDGCASGKKSAGNINFHFSKNINRFESEKDYNTGWIQGYQFCKEEQKNYYKVKREAERNGSSSKLSEKIWNELKK